MSNISGQANERNLVKAIKKYAPFKVKINGKTYTVLDAEQLGGGNPEPKADVSIITQSGNLGISMKKPNFGFFESWMNEEKTLNMLISVGMDKKEAGNIVDGLKEKAKEVTTSKKFKTEVLNEYDALVEIVGKTHKALGKIQNSRGKFIIDNFSMDATTKNDLVKKLLKDKKKRFGSSSISSTFQVENVYVPLNELLGRNYKSFLERVIGGAKTGPNKNPFPAEFVLQATIPPTIKESKLIETIETSQSINQVVESYSTSDDVNLKFRLRPITATRAAYSTTNAGKYRKGSEFYSDDKVGVSWTVHVSV